MTIQPSTAVERQALVHAALLASDSLGIPILLQDTQPEHAEALGQLAVYFRGWADLADQAIARRSPDSPPSGPPAGG